jgi:hypothetical protein
MWHKPFRASTPEAQTCMKFYTHICLNIDIVVDYSYEYPRGRDDISVCADVMEYFFVGYILTCP